MWDRGANRAMSWQHSKALASSRRFLIAVRPPRTYAWRHGGRDANTERNRSGGPARRERLAPPHLRRIAQARRQEDGPRTARTDTSGDSLGTRGLLAARGRRASAAVG